LKLLAIVRRVVLKAFEVHIQLLSEASQDEPAIQLEKAETFAESVQYAWMFPGKPPEPTAEEIQPLAHVGYWPSAAGRMEAATAVNWLGFIMLNVRL
jgi:hypothetical protein